MSEEQTICSFGDPNAHPPTPQQTPNTATFASPIFETPKHPQGSFSSDLGNQTPRFAEDYSVFNSTPGNLRGSQGRFGEFVPATPGGHKRLLSAEGLALDIASHATHFSPNPDAPHPPVEPSHRLASSPGLITPQKGRFQNREVSSSKKARRGTVNEDSQASQIISPPPTARKSQHHISPKLNMQNDQSFGQPDFGDMAQSQDMAALMSGHHGDMFSYPLSAPAGGHFSWDTDTRRLSENAGQFGMTMDLDFNAAGANMFASPASGHRATGSFDWNNNIQLFQEANMVPPSSNQENMQPGMQQLAMVPNGHMGGHASAAALTNCAMPTAYPTALDDPFGLLATGDGVDPGLLLSRPTSAAMDANFNAVDESMALQAPQSVPPKTSTRPGNRRSNTDRSGKMPDRATASSPIKSSRPNLTRSVSENRGRKAMGRRGSLPVLAPAARQPHQATGGSGMDGNRSRPGGRISPLKTQRRLSGLASIPEAPIRQQLQQQARRASVRFTIDSHGRARAETTLLADGSASSGRISRSQSSRDLSFRSQWESSDADSSDEEPIIIPSRTSSFNASFALPDPRKPVGSIFHGPKRSISDKSTSTLATGDDGRFADVESEAETVLNDPQEKGDAASELRKVVRGRQKRANAANAQPKRLLTNLGHFQDGTISPSSLTESGYGTDGQGVRCICNRSGTNEGDGFMVQCESCEMWLHGKCLNITKRTMPSVYICRFCANTSNMNRNNALGLAPAISPPTNKSFRTFR